MFFVSELGGINGDILVLIPKQLDEQQTFVRADGWHPMIILDGHESCLKLPFLIYVNEVATKWGIGFGTPYGTSYWQVADSPEQNGSFKWHGIQRR